MKASGASGQTRVSPLSGSFKVLAVLAAIAGFGLAAKQAEATHASHGAAATTKNAVDTVTSVAAKDVETTSSVQTNTASDAHCDVSRKRLFVEGEGWIVRRVTTCY